MAITLKFRRDVKANWLLTDSILALGEPGYETDTGCFKIGNGEARWADLEYFEPGATHSNHALYEELMAHVNSVVIHPVYNEDDGPSLFLLYENAKV